MLATFALLYGCYKAPDGWNAPFRPYRMRISDSDTTRLGADDDVSKGFNDGCVSAMTIITVGLPQAMAPRIDGWKMTGRNPENPKESHPEIKSGKIYTDAFMDGFEHCTYQYDWWVL